MRKIIHVDMDCFFAAVEMRDNPALRDIPLAIGGSRVQRGVISTANYPARKFGVRSAMPTATALKAVPASHAASRPLRCLQRSLESYPRNFLPLYLAH